jgi:hypothetical protein
MTVLCSGWLLQSSLWLVWRSLHNAYNQELLVDALWTSVAQSSYVAMAAVLLHPLKPHVHRGEHMPETDGCVHACGRWRKPMSTPCAWLCAEAPNKVVAQQRIASHLARPFLPSWGLSVCCLLSPSVSLTASSRCGDTRPHFVQDRRFCKLLNALCTACIDPFGTGLLLVPVVGVPGA